MAEAPGPPENLNVLLPGPSEQMKKCTRCHQEREHSEFTGKAGGKLYAKCNKCRKAIAKRCKVRIVGDKKRCTACEVLKPFDAFAKSKSGDGRLLLLCMLCSDKRAKIKKSDVGKAADKKYKEGEAGKAARERQKKLRNARQRARYAMDPAYKLMCQIGISLAEFISGRRATAGTFAAHAGMSADDMYDHLVDQLKAKGLKMDDYGITWEVEHKIPQEMYDFSDPADVKRC